MMISPVGVRPHRREAEYLCEFGNYVEIYGNYVSFIALPSEQPETGVRELTTLPPTLSIAGRI